MSSQSNSYEFYQDIDNLSQLDYRTENKRFFKYSQEKKYLTFLFHQIQTNQLAQGVFPKRKIRLLSQFIYQIKSFKIKQLHQYHIHQINIHKSIHNILQKKKDEYFSSQNQIKQKVYQFKIWMASQKIKKLSMKIRKQQKFNNVNQTQKKSNFTNQIQQNKMAIQNCPKQEKKSEQEKQEQEQEEQEKQEEQEQIKQEQAEQLCHVIDITNLQNTLNVKSSVKPQKTFQQYQQKEGEDYLRFIKRCQQELKSNLQKKNIFQKMFNLKLPQIRITSKDLSPFCDLKPRNDSKSSQENTTQENDYPLYYFGETEPIKKKIDIKLSKQKYGAFFKKPQIIKINYNCQRIINFTNKNQLQL